MKLVFKVLLTTSLFVIACGIPRTDYSVSIKTADESYDSVPDSRRTCVQDEDCLGLDWCKTDGFCSFPFEEGKECNRDEMCIFRNCAVENGKGICKTPVQRIARWLIWALVIGAVVVIALCCILVCCCCSCCAAV